ncbi:putative RNA-binding protein ARP1, partial [Mucuna pruriens]
MEADHPPQVFFIGSAKFNMTPVNLAGQFGDTTYTKVFVGGLAWETQKETMKKYFEQFGEILEAVVITDKATGRSKGYGFVTFREPEAAMRACVDAAPVIDGRRANCNLASLGVQRSKPSTPKHGGAGRNFRVMGSFQTGFGGGVGSAFPSAATFPHYAIQQGIPYNVYGYSPYSPDYTYPTSYYGVYGGATAQYPVYGSGAGGMMTGATAFYPYVQYGEGSGGGTSGGYSSGQGYGVNYPPQLFQYSPAAAAYTQHYGTPMSLAPSPALQSGANIFDSLFCCATGVTAPIPHR